MTFFVTARARIGERLGPKPEPNKQVGARIGKKSELEPEVPSA